MTDLQVKFQTLEHEKEKLAEEKRYHDAAIQKMGLEGEVLKRQAVNIKEQTAKLQHEGAKVQEEIRLLNEQIEWYAAQQVSDIIYKGFSGPGNFLKGVGSLFA